MLALVGVDDAMWFPPDDDVVEDIATERYEFQLKIMKNWLTNNTGEFIKHLPVIRSSMHQLCVKYVLKWVSIVDPNYLAESLWSVVVLLQTNKIYKFLMEIIRRTETLNKYYNEPAHNWIKTISMKT